MDNSFYSLTSYYDIFCDTYNNTLHASFHFCVLSYAAGSSFCNLTSYYDNTHDNYSTLHYDDFDDFDDESHVPAL